MKIFKVKKKNSYELTYLIPVIYTDSELKQLDKDLEVLLKKLNAKVLQKADWGKRKLAYQIKKAGKVYNEAFYYHWLIELDTEQVSKLERSLSLDEKIIRHLLVKHEAEQSALPAEKEAKE